MNWRFVGLWMAFFVGGISFAVAISAVRLGWGEFAPWLGVSWISAVSGVWLWVSGGW